MAENEWGSLKSLVERYKETAAKEAAFCKRRTGFANLDGENEFKADGQKQIFVPGIYVIGAPSSLGKTTFCLQLLTQLADRGEQCLYLSYEMGELNLFRKLIARDLFERKLNGKEVTLVSAADIRRAGTTNADINTSLDSLADASTMRIKYVGDWDSSTLIKKLYDFAKSINVAPVVCIDYLQLVPAPSSRENMTAKEKVDKLLSDLRKFQNDTSSTLILISSLNRASKQDNGITLSSFKESGSIEYTADVIWALEPAIEGDETFAEAERREREKTCRAMQLRCLKSREDSLYKVFFQYHANRDCFVPCAEDKIFDEPDTKRRHVR